MNDARWRGSAAALLLCAAWLAAGCQGPRGEPPPPLTDSEEEAARTLGAEAAVVLQSTLGPRLLEAIEAGGVEEAIRFCSMAADSLTSSAAQAAGYTLKRTSSRLRNQANAADAWDLLALSAYERTEMAGDSPPSGLVQAVSADEVRYYAPLLVAPVCLNCHGEPEDLAPGVDRLLAELYPMDEAVGYHTGELRGLVRVSIPRKGLSTPDH